MTFTLPTAATPYLSAVNAAADKYGIPQQIYQSLIYSESSYNPNALSSTGAVGLAQLEPSTAFSLGINPYDDTQNINGGAQILAQNYAATGNWTTALEMYNGGNNYANIPSTATYANTILSNAQALGYNSSNSSTTTGNPVTDFFNGLGTWFHNTFIVPATNAGISFVARIGLAVGAVIIIIFAFTNLFDTDKIIEKIVPIASKAAEIAA